MPAYNAQAFIGEAIISIINQSFPWWELIVVNDGSTDETQKIVAEHMEQDANGPIKAFIQMSEPLGANTLLHGELANETSAITVSLPGVHTIDPSGKEMAFKVEPENLHLFDIRTGRRLAGTPGS